MYRTMVKQNNSHNLFANSFIFPISNEYRQQRTMFTSSPRVYYTGPYCEIFLEQLWQNNTKSDQKPTG